MCNNLFKQAHSFCYFAVVDATMQQWTAPLFAAERMTSCCKLLLALAGEEGMCCVLAVMPTSCQHHCITASQRAMIGKFLLLSLASLVLLHFVRSVKRKKRCAPLAWVRMPVDIQTTRAYVFFTGRRGFIVFCTSSVVERARQWR